MVKLKATEIPACLLRRVMHSAKLYYRELEILRAWTAEGAMAPKMALAFDLVTRERCFLLRYYYFSLPGIIVRYFFRFYYFLPNISSLPCCLPALHYPCWRLCLRRTVNDNRAAGTD